MSKRLKETQVIPVVKFPDGSSKNDSTPLLQSLDRTVVERPLIPQSPGQKFMSLLLEDLFDEWLVKVMFGMRWIEEVDRDWSGSWIMYDTMMGGGTDLDNVRYDNNDLVVIDLGYTVLFCVTGQGDRETIC